MEKLDLAPALAAMERFIGFTIPRHGRFYVCDHDEVVQVTLDGQISAEAVDEHPYKFVEGNPDFLGLVFEGLLKNEPILRVGSATISYVFDPTDDFVSVKYEVAGLRGVLEFRTFSGDWFVASLSEDGRYLVLAEPYEVALYRLS
jgi:hypothetical protein